MGTERRSRSCGDWQGMHFSSLGHSSQRRLNFGSRAHYPWQTSSAQSQGHPYVYPNTLSVQSNYRTPISKDNRVFNGPDGYQYRWRPSNNSFNDVVVRAPSLPLWHLGFNFFSYLQLQDHNGNVIAFYRPVRPVRYNLGDVYGELHFCRSAGAGVVVRSFSLRRLLPCVDAGVSTRCILL